MKFNHIDLIKHFDKTIELARNGKPCAHMIVNCKDIYIEHLKQLYMIDLKIDPNQNSESKEKK